MTLGMPHGITSISSPSGRLMERCTPAQPATTTGLLERLSGATLS
jgi:hypothetical protein